MPDDTTFVWRESATVQPGDIRVDLLAVDPATFARGAAWRPTSADAPLSDVLAAAGTAPSAGGSTSSVLAVGQTVDGTPVPASGQLVSGGWSAVGFEVADRPESFPGMRENVPLIVVDARRFFPLIGPYDPTAPETQVNPVRQVFRPEIWSAGSPTDVERYLVSRDTRLLDVQTPEQVAARPDLLAPLTTAAWLQLRADRTDVAECCVSPSEVTGTAAWCEGVHRIYRTVSGEVHALRGVDVTIPAGRLTVTGAGSGVVTWVSCSSDRATTSSAS